MKQRIENALKWWVELKEPTDEQWRRLWSSAREWSEDSGVEHGSKLIMALCEHDRRKWYWACQVMKGMIEDD